MSTTDSLYRWWFEQWGVGGWVVFLVLAIAAIAWIIYDTQARRIRALGWLMGTILPALLLVPSALLSLSPNMLTQMQHLLETFFYLGVIGGIVPFVVAVGYGITFKGLCGCDQGHLYDSTQSQCPFCAQEQVVEGISLSSPLPVDLGQRKAELQSRPDKPRTSAWLVDERTEDNYQLCRGDTRLGRKPQANDIVFADKAISREHALIREEPGGFTIYDRGSRSGTYVNSGRLQGPVPLVHGDIIEIGDMRLRFVAS